MPAWAKLAWMNRDRIIAAGKALHWPLRTWLRLGGLAVAAVGVYLAATYGYLDRWNPTTFSNAQWAQLIVNVIGFGIIYVAMRSWWGRQDEVWDEVAQMRTQIDELREALWEHEHEIVEAEVDPDSAEAHPGEWLPEPEAPVVDIVDKIATEELPAPPAVEAREPATTAFQAIRQAPISDRERPTVEREIGGRVFRFTASEETSELG